MSEKPKRASIPKLFQQDAGEETPDRSSLKKPLVADRKGSLGGGEGEGKKWPPLKSPEKDQSQPETPPRGSKLFPKSPLGDPGTRQGTPGKSPEQQETRRGSRQFPPSPEEPRRGSRQFPPSSEGRSTPEPRRASRQFPPEGTPPEEKKEPTGARGSLQMTRQGSREADAGPGKQGLLPRADRELSSNSRGSRQVPGAEQGATEEGLTVEGGRERRRSHIRTRVDEPSVTPEKEAERVPRVDSQEAVERRASASTKRPSMTEQELIGALEIPPPQEGEGVGMLDIEAEEVTSRVATPVTPSEAHLRTPQQESFERLEVQQLQQQVESLKRLLYDNSQDKKVARLQEEVRAKAKMIKQLESDKAALLAKVQKYEAELKEGKDRRRRSFVGTGSEKDKKIESQQKRIRELEGMLGQASFVSSKGGFLDDLQLTGGGDTSQQVAVLQETVCSLRKELAERDVALKAVQGKLAKAQEAIVAGIDWENDIKLQKTRAALEALLNSTKGVESKRKSSTRSKTVVTSPKGNGGVEFTDSNGRTVRFAPAEKDSVAGLQRWVDDMPLGFVTSLFYHKGELRDQSGITIHLSPAAQEDATIRRLAALADTCGIPHNLPKGACVLVAAHWTDEDHEHSFTPSPQGGRIPGTAPPLASPRRKGSCMVRSATVDYPPMAIRHSTPIYSPPR